MKIKLLLLPFLVSLLTPFLSNGTDQSDQLWKKMLPKLRSALELTEKQEELPDSSLLKDDKKSNQNEINGLLDEAVSLLSTSGAATSRQEIQKLELEIREANKKILEYEEAKVSAPEDKPVWKAWQTTKKDYSEKIEDEKKKIEGYRERIEQRKDSISKDLQNLGLDISSDQVDFLLSTVVGDNIIQVVVSFENVKTLTLQLEKLMVQSGENVDVARRYYGMYMILLNILDRMYAQILNDIDHKYLPQINGGKDHEGRKMEGIIPKTKRLQKETQKLLKTDGSEKNTKLLSANLQAQQLTLEAASLYSTYLEKQRSELSNAKEKLQPDLNAAKNTYETVQVSSELVAMIKSGRNLFETVRNIQIPELRIFQNLEMKKEFEKLTVELKSR